MIKKIIYYILIVLISIILLINIFSIFKVSFMGFRVYKIASGSMNPTLKINDLVLIKKANTYKENDIVTFKNNKEYITHRIIEINKDEIITRGDFNNTNDKPINKDNIVGKVVYKFKILKFLNNLFSKPLFWLLLLLGSSVILFIPRKEEKDVK